jgi:hypothetical protein
LAHGDDFGRRLLLSVDAKSYGSGDDQRQAAIQDGLLAVLDEAAAGARLTRIAWMRQEAGDGELAVLPPGDPEPRLVDDFVLKLHAALTRHNDDLIPEARLRLRVAIHNGVALRARNGFSGQGVVVVGRLVDSRPLKEALNAATEANLAVALSQRVYEDTVVQRHTSLRATDFRRVRVRNKEFVADAWIRVLGADVHTLDIADDLPEPSPGRAEPTRQAESGRRAEPAPQGRAEPVPAGPGSAPTGPGPSISNHLSAEVLHVEGSNFGWSR